MLDIHGLLSDGPLKGADLGSMSRSVSTTKPPRRLRKCAWYDGPCKAKAAYEALTGQEPPADAEVYQPGELGSGTFDPVPDSVRKGIDEATEGIEDFKGTVREGAEKVGTAVKVVFYVGAGLLVLWLATRLYETYGALRKSG